MTRQTNRLQSERRYALFYSICFAFVALAAVLGCYVCVFSVSAGLISVQSGILKIALLISLVGVAISYMKGQYRLFSEIGGKIKKENLEDP